MTRPPALARPWQALWLAAACGVAAPVAAQGLTPSAGCTELPFGQELDVGQIRALALTPPEAVLDRIASLGIDVYRVPSAAPRRPANPVLLPLAVADPALLAGAAFESTMQGRAIPRDATCCSVPRDTILIRDTATTFTLLHEVAHLLIRPLGAPPLVDVEQRFALAFHRLTVYQRRLYDDPARLLDPRWRRDIVAAQRETVDLLYDRIRIGQSQEAIVEHVLGRCIDEASPYRDAARAAEGRRYAVAMVDNAIDVFNAVHGSIAFCADAVGGLHGDVEAGRIALPPGTALDAADAAAFSDAAQALQRDLVRTRGDIEALKRFHSEGR
ncbi:MAG: hypothetical protein HXY24_07050 [Rubrivivax sp.]|nr:hypothetical protein [Rubrivivax sp.]